VIRQEEEFAPGASHQAPLEWAAAMDRQPSRDQQSPPDPLPFREQRPPQDQPPRAEPLHPDPLADSDPSTFVYRDVGGPDEPDEPQTAEPGVPYGPDDPAYGPPSPDWYAREDETEAGQQEAAEEPQYVRGPFEPPPHSGAAARAMEPLDVLDDNDPGSPGDRALEQIKDLYLTAEAIGAENLDRHFEELLERQRQLISEYFKEGDVRESAAATGSTHGNGGEHRAVAGLADLNGLGSGHLAFGADQRSPR
jgi:hypothetical protein